jgi:hypothetical protein
VLGSVEKLPEKKTSALRICKQRLSTLFGSLVIEDLFTAFIGQLNFCTVDQMKQSSDE